MTRAPLPGKLPEWPEWQEDDLDYAGYYHELAICWESRARLAVEALCKIASGDPKQVYSPIGPLHAAGIIFQWEIDAKICKEAIDLCGPFPEEDRT